MKKKEKQMPTPLTKEEVDGLSDAQIQIMLARESLLRYGTVLPPSNRPDAQGTRVVPEVPEKPVTKGKPNWKLEKHTCPRCGHSGPVDPDFGVKTVRGVTLSQSWCKDCRSGTNYHARKPTYEGATKKRLGQGARRR